MSRRGERRAAWAVLAASMGALSLCSCDAVRAPAPTDDPDLESRLIAAQQVYYRDHHDSSAVLFAGLREEAREAGDARTAAAATMWMGLDANRRAQYDSARILGEEALALQIQGGFDDLIPRAYNALGLLAWEDLRPVTADSLFSLSIESAERVGMSYLAAVARGNRGLALQDLGDYEGAREGLEAQLAAAVEADSVLSAATARLNLAVLSIQEGDPLTASRTLPGVIEAMREFDNPLRVQNAMAQLAEAYADLGDPQHAFVMYDSALTVARENGLDLDVARNLDALAALHQRLGNLHRALEIYDESRAELEARGLTTEVAWNRRNSAEIRARLGDTERARDDAREALSVHEVAGLRLEQIDDHILLAQIEHEDGDSEGAQRHLSAAGALAEEIDHAPSRLRLMLTAAGFQLSEGRHSEARALLEANAGTFEDAAPDLRAQAYGLLAHTRAAEGDFEAAATAGELAVQSIEQVRSRFGSAEMRATFLDDRSDVYGDLAAMLFRLGRTEEAFAVADAARGRGLTTVGGSSERSSELSAVAKRDQLLARVSDLAAKLDTARLDPGTWGAAATAAIQTRLDEARRDYAAAYRDARERLGADGAFLGIGDVSLSEVQSTLRTGEVLLEYLVTADRVWTIIVTRNAIVPTSIAVDGEELASRVRIARDLIASPENGARIIAPVMAALHEMLIGQARRSGALAGARLLTIVPHTVLNYLPFAALVDPTTDRYLIEDFDIRYLPSAAALPALAERSPVEDVPRPALFAPRDEELPETRAEVDRIGDVVGRSHRYLGDRGTEARLRSALEDGAWVHLATHGVMNAQSPMFSRVDLGGGRPDRPEDDGRLEVHEVLGMNIRSPLVFLSGCETGVGNAWATVQGRGEDQTTLERAFLYAGAANVIATLWPIDDRGGAQLAAAFYEPADGSETPAARLGDAQRSLLGTEWASPYYWAGYRLSGTNRLGG